MPLSREHLLDELATAYVQVVVATAGATIALRRLDYGVYGTLSHVVQASKEGSQEYKFIPDGFVVEFQIKGTTDATVHKDFISYDLKAKNYDLIVSRPSIGTPIYLFLVCFAAEAEGCIEIQKNQLILRASAYWWKRSDAPMKGSTTVRIEIPIVSRLTPNALQYMLEVAKNRLASEND
jgi:hypothetical protein